MKKLLIALGFLWSAAVPAMAADLKPSLYYASLAGADLYSTSYAEARGAVEANPLMKGQGSRYALKVAQVGALTWLDNKAGKKSKKLQLGIRIFAGALTAGVVAHNLRQGR